MRTPTCVPASCDALLQPLRALRVERHPWSSCVSIVKVEDTGLLKETLRGYEPRICLTKSHPNSVSCARSLLLTAKNIDDNVVILKLFSSHLDQSRFFNRHVSRVSSMSMVRGYEGEVVISCESEVIARFRRSYERDDFVVDPI